MNRILQSQFSPRITFGMIVLNGEPFTRYNLRSIYPWAHQIIVVEGACLAAASVASEEGHSTDGTLDVLHSFQAEEDPQNKITIITAEDEGYPNGFWLGEKHEMSQAYAKRATGNYLWQVDADEFYLEEDMKVIMDLLLQGVDVIDFPTVSFWGGLEFVENGEYFLTHGAWHTPRVFAWGPGYTYLTHRPATVLDQDNIDMRNKNWVQATQLKKSKVNMYHYSMLLPKQVREKCAYYSQVDWAGFQGMEQWSEQVFFSLKKPFAICQSLHCPLSWIESFHGSHPEQILEMVKNIQSGKHPNIELRATDDIALLLRSPLYRIGRLIRRIWVFIIAIRNKIENTIISFLKRAPFYSALRKIRQSLQGN